jgi:Zn-dependent protease with chaperone function
VKTPAHFANVESDEARKVGCALSLPLVFAGMALTAIGYSGLLAARIVRSAFAREREYLADASAVQFTQDPESLSSALKKIGGLSVGSRILHPRSEELSHFFFSDGLKDVLRKPGGWFRGWSRTHPSLFDRIQRIDGRFDGKYIVPVEVGEAPTPATEMSRQS